MFSWIDRWFVHPIANVIGDVLSLVHGLIKGVYGFFSGLKNILWYAWADMYNGAVSLWRGAREFAGVVYQRFIHLYRAVIPYLESYTHWVLTLLGKIIGEAKQFLYNLILSTYHWALATFDATRKWAINEIWNPLFKSLTSALHWLTHEGAMMLHYFTHLGDFAELLFWNLIRSLESHAWDAGKLLGRFFLSLFYHNAVRFATLMEDIVDAIL